MPGGSGFQPRLNGVVFSILFAVACDEPFGRELRVERLSRVENRSHIQKTADIKLQSSPFDQTGHSRPAAPLVFDVEYC